MVFTIGVCLLLWLIGTYFIYKKSTRGQTIRRTLFLLLALTGLALIIIRPQYSVDVKAEVVHINTSNNSIDSIASAFKFDDVHTFLRSDISDRTAEVHIHGIGLDREALDLLEDKKIVLHQSELISGITHLSIPQITEREQWILSGTFQGADVDRIYLVGADASIHEATIANDKFTISSIAPVAGDYLLEVHTILSTKDTLKELLPIEVAHEPKWQMLVLAAYPSFEINYLKNYWTALGNGFALRSKISKEKFNNSFVNSKRQNLDVLTRRVIETFDFIITDGPSWNQLSTSEQSNIKRAVSNDGLALIIRPSTTEVVTNNLQIPRRDQPTEIKWKTSADDVALNHFNIQSSWRATRQQDHVIARYQANGLGHIAVLGIDNTYKLILADQELYYQNLWSGIFSDLYRDFSPTAKLLHHQWIWEGEKTTMSILSNEDVDTPPLLNDSISLPYLRVPYLNGVTDVSLWPIPGYNRITLEVGGVELKFYAHQKASWNAVKQVQLGPINKQAAKASSTMPTPIFREGKPISMFWWYALCLLGFGMLWLDERLFD